MFRPLTKNEQERLDLIKNCMSKDVAKDFLEKCDSLESYYYYAVKLQNGVCSQMQVYILDNYKKVPLEYWNKKTFKINPHLSLDKVYYYFGKKDTFKPKWKNHKRLQKREKKRYDESIKIISIDFTLDYFDGDFSVNFNDGAWCFLGNEEVLRYYLFIKNYVDANKSIT